MKRLFWSFGILFCFALLSQAAFATCPIPFIGKDATGANQNLESFNDGSNNCIFANILTDPLGNPLLTKTAYRIAGGPISSGVATTPTDWLVLTGSGTKTIRLTNFTICGTATSASTIDLVLTKHSTANTGGTTGTAPTATPLDSTDAAVSATFAIYTANPTVGTLVGSAVDTIKLNLGAAGSAGCAALDFGTRNAQAVVLRGTTQQFAVNLNSVSLPSGYSLDYRLEWTEE